MYYASPLWSIAMIPLAILYSLISSHVLPRQQQQQQFIRTEHSSSSIFLQDGQQLIAIVTGANTGIGFETARALALNYHQYTVILACRSLDKGYAAAQAIQSEDSTAKVRVMQLDLNDFQSIQSFVQEMKSVAILVNNAGCNTDTSALLFGKWNVLFQTNFVGHFYLTQLLLQQDAFVKNARLVQVSSVMHHFAPYEEQWIEPEFWKQVAGPSTQIRDRYSLSKLAAILFSIQLNRMYGDRLRSIAVNPGAV